MMLSTAFWDSMVSLSLTWGADSLLAPWQTPVSTQGVKVMAWSLPERSASVLAEVLVQLGSTWGSPDFKLAIRLLIRVEISRYFC